MQCHLTATLSPPGSPFGQQPDPMWSLRRSWRAGGAGRPRYASQATSSAPLSANHLSMCSDSSSDWPS